MRIVGLTLLALVALLVAVAAFVLVTPPGARLALQLAAPDELEVERVDGRLWGDLRMQGLRWAHERAEVTIAELAVRWTPGALLDRALVVEEVHAADVTVRLRPPPPEETEPAEALPELELPVRVQIDSALATNVTIHAAPAAPGEERPWEEPLRLERLTFRADLWRDGAIEFAADAGAPEVQPALAAEARLQGRLLARGAYPMELRLDWEARPEGEPALAGEGRAEGDLRRLAMVHTLHEPVPARLAAEVRELMDELAWSAEVDVPRFRLADVRRDWPPHAVEGRVVARGGREGVHGTGSGRLFPAEGGEVTAFVTGSYAEDRLLLDSLVLGAPPAEGRLTASGEIRLGQEQPSFRLSGAWSDLAWPPEPGTAWAARRAVAEGTSPGARAAAEGRPGAGARAAAGGRSGRQPGASERGPDIESPRGAFRVEGTTARYTIGIRALVDGPDVPSGDWRLEGVGDSASLVVRELRGETLEGEVRGSGRLSWSPEPAWRFELTGEGLKPEVWAPRWPGEIDLRLVTGGETRGGIQRISLELEELTGTLRGEPVEAVLRLGLAGERVDVDTARLRYGDATIQARGSAGERLDVTWAADIPDLSLLAADTLRPELAGALEAEGSLVGPRNAPEIGFVLRGEALETRELQVAALEGRGAVDLSGSTPSRLQVAAAGLRTERGLEGGLALDELTLRGEGTPDDHRLVVTGNRDEERFRGAVTGSLVGARPGAPATAREWAGRVEELALDTDRTEWRLRQPAALRAGPDMVALDTLCWQQVGGTTVGRAPGARAAAGVGADEAAYACLTGSWARETGGRGELAADGVPLELFAPFMPAEFEATGALTLRAAGEVSPEGEARGTARLRAGPGRLFYVRAPGDRIERPYETVALELEALEGMLEAALEVEVQDGTAEGYLRLPLETAEGSRPIEGRFVGRFDDRGLLGALSLELERTAGLLDADLAFSGTTEEPRATGRVALTGGEASVLDLGIRVHEVELEAAGETESEWRIQGALRSGEGALEVDGTARLATAAEPWEADISLRGERFEVYNTADAWLLASPDLRAQGSADGLLFTGTVHLPFGRITPEDLQLLAIQPSPDVVLVGPGTEQAEEPEEPPLPIPIRAEIDLVAGDSLLLDAMGVEGRVVGRLAVSYAADRPTTARGELDLVEGTYTAYHQELGIERGRLMYADLPLTNPGLDIRVSREPQEGIRVGLDVRGRAQDPDARLFSEPIMPEAEALSWLLLGRTLAGADAQEGELLADAARTAGFAGGELLAGRLAAAFGLEEARVERDPEGGAFILGAQLAPNLYVAYTIGLFEAADILNIRYELGRWTLTTQTGFETAADILYRAGGEELPAPELVPELGADAIGGEAIRDGGARP